MLGLTFIIIALFPLGIGFRLWIEKRADSLQKK